MSRPCSLRVHLKKSRGASGQLAAALGVSASLVTMWANGSRNIPIDQCHDIYCLTGVPLRLLRPDVFNLITHKPKSGAVLKNFLAAAARRQRS